MALVNSRPRNPNRTGGKAYVPGTRVTASRLFCLFGFVIGSTAFASAQATASPKPCAHARLVEKTSVSGYILEAYDDEQDRGDTPLDPPGCLRVYLGDKLAYRLTTAEEGATFTLGQPANPVANIPFVPNGSDLTGNRQPDMMVKSWSGGGHCCSTHYVFELKPKLRLIARLEDGATNLGHFDHLDRNGRYFYITDDIWDYWPQSFAGSVRHKVILKWNGRKFALDLDRMHTPPPTSQQWQSWLQQIDEAVTDAPDERAAVEGLWDTTLDLIYTRHSDLAWKLVGEVNPKAFQGNNPTLKEFCEMLKSRPYWPDLKLNLKDMPEECAKAKGVPQK
jgi:hypothetical protein